MSHEACVLAFHRNVLAQFGKEVSRERRSLRLSLAWALRANRVESRNLTEHPARPRADVPKEW